MMSPQFSKQSLDCSTLNSAFAPAWAAAASHLCTSYYSFTKLASSAARLQTFLAGGKAGGSGNCR